MVAGTCLCGAVKFQIAESHGVFELCHCSRCRKATGSAFLPTIRVRRQDFKLDEGAEQIRTYEAPVRETHPGYRSSFCAVCGSPAPFQAEGAFVEVPAGLLEQDPGVRPERHIYVEVKAPWFAIADSLPQLDSAAVQQLRQASSGT